jgi:trimeric autotransporter adhesin
MSSFTNTSAGTDSLDGSTGFWNTAYGAYTLSGANNGKNNVAVGGNALLINSEGSYNTAVGTAALTFNTVGNLNIAMGNNAMCGNTSGDQNTAIGVQSLSVSNVYDNNTALGYHSASNISAGNNTAIGSETLYNSVASSGNTALGYRAGYFAVTGEGNNTYLGINTGQASGDVGIYSNSTAIGSGATISDSHQITIGTSAEYIKLGGRVEQALNVSNCQFGTGALKNSTTTAVACTAIGVNAAKALNNAVNTTAIGSNALLNYTASDSGFQFGNTAIGSAAMYNTSTGGGNTAVGIDSLLTNTTGYSNVGVGLFSLYKNNSGSNNTCVGQSSGYNITSGYQNIAIGNDSMSGVDIGAFNVSVGNDTLNSKNTNSCVALGFAAGQYDYGGSGNTYLGYNSGPASSVASPLPVFNNSTAIGSNSVTTASNQVVLGVTTSTVTIPGRFEQGWANGNMQYGFGSMEEPVTGSNNTAVGVYASQILTGSSNTTAFGQGALGLATSGASGCTAIGRAALFSNNGVSNTAVGYEALWLNTIGVNNVAVGAGAFNKMTGSNGVAIGNSAAPNATSGNVNIAIGADAMGGTILGSYNTCVGNTTLTVGDTTACTAIGHFAGRYSADTSEFNTYVGYESGPASGSAVFTQSTALGYGAITTASNQMMIGRNTETVEIPGALEVTGYPVAAQPLYINTGISSVTTYTIPITIINDSVFLIVGGNTITLPDVATRPGLRLTFVANGGTFTIFGAGTDGIIQTGGVGGGQLVTNATRDSVTLQSMANSWQVVATTSTSLTIS